MSEYSQNKKIAISAIALFIASFSTMLFFLEGKGLNSDHGAVNVVESGGHSQETKSEQNVAEKVKKDEFSFDTDVEGVITEANKGFCGILGKKCGNLIGIKIFDLVNKQDLADLASAYGKLAQNGQRMEGIGPLRIGRGEDEKILLFSAQPILDKKEKVLYIQFSGRDITGKLEEFKNEMNDKKNGGLMERIYPKIKELNEKGSKMLVKISYKGEK